MIAGSCCEKWCVAFAYVVLYEWEVLLVLHWKTGGKVMSFRTY